MSNSRVLKRKSPQRVYFSDDYERSLNLHDADGTFIHRIKASVIASDEGIVLYISDEIDEPFEPDSASVIKFRLDDIIVASLNWTEGEYSKSSSKYKYIINELEHLIGKLKIRMEDNDYAEEKAD